MSTVYYAHSLEGAAPSCWQPLEDHLRQVSALAGDLARSFGCEPWAGLAGLWHDLGKYSEGFQGRLRGGGPVDHATAGARRMMELQHRAVGKLLSYAIAGYHGGLPDGGRSRGCLGWRLQKDLPPLPDLPGDILQGRPIGPPPLALERARAGFQLSSWVRMIFSCLVDADFLDTEGFMDPQRGSLRRGRPDLTALKAALDRRLACFGSPECLIG